MPGGSASCQEGSRRLRGPALSPRGPCARLGHGTCHLPWSRLLTSQLLTEGACMPVSLRPATIGTQ